MGIPLDAAPRRVVSNEAPVNRGAEDAAAGAIDHRVGRVDPTAGEVYSPEGVVGADEEMRARDAARTPSIFLAAPGMVSLLFAGMADKIAGGSAFTLVLVATIAASIGGACFGVISAKAESSEAKLFWLCGVGLALALWLRAVVMAF